MSTAAAVVPESSDIHRPVFQRVEVNRLPEMGFDVVFKIQETCNINCSYCYMYNVGNIAYKSMPQQADLETCRGVARLIVKEFAARRPNGVRLILHGGEPMLMKAEAMDQRLTLIDDHLRHALTAEQYAKMMYSIQTNATLVNPAWMALIEKWSLQVSVSIDGAKATNDRRRVDKKGLGTYDRVVTGIKMLRENERLRTGLGALCVVDPTADGAATYRHLVDDLGFRAFNFLLPFMNWDSYDQATVDGAGRFYVDAFREWKKDVRSGKMVHVRVFREAMESFLSAGSFDRHRTVQDILYDVFVADCDGTIMTEESLRPSFEGRFSELNVNDVGIDDIGNDPRFVEVARDTFSLSDECDGCALLGSCRSGQSVGRVGMRYSSTDDRLRKSVYCGAFIELYIEVAAFLQESGRDVATCIGADVAAPLALVG